LRTPPRGIGEKGGKLLWTIGHSDHSWEEWLKLLRGAGLSAIADVRSVPRSKRCPHFNGDTMAARLRAEGIAYVPLGKELGGRPEDPSVYRGGQVDYELLRETPLFRSGIERVIVGAKKGYRIALLCSEADPAYCHRALAVAPSLVEAGEEVMHILPGGRLEPHEALLRRLLRMTGEADIPAAVRAQSRRVAYRRT